MPNSKKVKASDNSKVENRNGRKKKSSGQNGKSKTFLCELCSYKANLLCHLKYHVSRVHAKIKDYPGLGSILDTVSKILKDTVIFSICTVSKIHFTLRVSYRIFQILHRVKDTDTFRQRLRPAHTQR